MNVTELARKLKITPNKLKEIMPQLGFDIGARAIKVDPKMAQAIIEKMSDPAVREKYLNEGEPMTKRETAQEEKKQEGEVGIIKVPEKIVVKELARRMNIPVANLILELMKNGVMAPLNQYIDFETASIIAEDMGFGVEKSEESDLEIDNEAEQRKLLAIDQDSASPRPPIVVVMGHVDHGKTKLLDAIRNTNIMEGEAGGITQHIGAYQVERGGRLLTFIDTPGHEAFSAMRSRGAKVADIAILLVAADDGVQPQTIEALAHIRKAELPFIVAINKIDKPGANIEKVKGDLANIGLAPEDWGGKTICVEISAKENINISLLLENLFLVADLNKEKIVANISVAAAGTIIESHIDKGEGPVATVLIQNGTLMGGDLVKIGNVVGKIRIMKNWKGEQIEKATPSMPVRILGLKAIPRVGDILQVVENQKELKKLSKIKISEPQRVVSNTFNSRDKNNEEENEKPKVNIILKSDVLGSVEAIIESLLKIEKGGVSVAVIKQGLGNITEKDIEQAAALGAEVLGFNVKITPEAKKMSTDKGVEAVVSGVIYDLLDFVEKKVIDLAGVEIIEKVVGRLKVVAIFRTEKREQIIGGKVESGRAVPEIQARVFRKNQLVGEIKIKEVEAGRTKVKEVLEGEECGMRIESKIEIEKNDVLELFTREEKKRYGQS